MGVAGGAFEQALIAAEVHQAVGSLGQRFPVSGEGAHLLEHGVAVLELFIEEGDVARQAQVIIHRAQKQTGVVAVAIDSVQLALVVTLGLAQVDPRSAADVLASANVGG